MSYRFIEYAVSEDIATITLNRPEVLNALTATMAGEFHRALEQAANEARVVVIGGAGRAFSSGADLAGGGIDLSNPERDAGQPLEDVFNPLTLAMRDLPIPIVTAVRGPAAGIACAIALSGDIIVAGEGAYFLQAFCRIGLVPDGGATYLLARSIGRVRAMEMMLLGERYGADRALADGLVTRVVADDAVDETARNFALRLAAGPPIALARTRRLAWEALDSSLEVALQREREGQKAASRTDDFVEGVTAFLQKRKAEFSGR